MNNFVLILAFGVDEVFAEARFLLLRQLAIADGRESNYEFVIYTDRPEAFDMFRPTNLRMRLVHCDPARFKAWRGAIDFVFRIKIEFLRDFCSRNEGNVLYLDSDVYPRGDLARLFEAIGRGEVFMYSSEGLIDQCPWYDDFKQLFARTPFVLGGVEQWFPTNARMWNAGVIGFSTAHRRLLDRVLEMTEAVYPQLRAPATEQFAFSYVLGQQHGTIRDTETYLHHYCGLAQRGFADVITRLLKRFEDRPLAELIAATEHILPERLEPVRPHAFGRMPHHRLYARFPQLWRAVNGIKLAGRRRAMRISRFYPLVESL
jgi:hypothetical protein